MTSYAIGPFPAALHPAAAVGDHLLDEVALGCNSIDIVGTDVAHKFVPKPHHKP